MFWSRLQYFALVACILLLLHFKGADCILKEDQVKKAKAGVLVYKDKQTSCALAAIDSKAAVVAADCLDKHIIEIDPREYSVYFNDGIDGKTARYNVESVTIHPEYNSTTLANNIAVLQYNSNSTNIEWQNTILVGGSTIFYFFYSLQFTLEDVETMTWAQYSYTTVVKGDNATCKSMSPQFAENELGLFCSTRIMDFSITNLSKCPVPYGSLYNIYKGPSMLVAGVHSFSAVSGGDSLCSYRQQRSYYTMVGLYAEYLKGVIGRNITLVYDEPFYEQGAKELSKNPNFSMNKTSSATDSHVSVITGNMYVNQTTDSESSSDFASNETGNSNNSQGTSSNSSDTSDQAGSSNTAGIIAGACIGAVGLLIICGVIYYVRLIRKKNPGIADPMRNNDFQNMLETSRPMQANVGDYHIDPLVDYDLPPIYEEVPSK